jgi:HK97 family phage major capsid protein
MPELTQESVEALTSGIKSAKESLDSARADMAKHNEHVDELLKSREKLTQTVGEQSDDLRKVNTKLEDHAARMEQIAEQYTKTINTLREQMKQLGTDGGDERSAFVARNGHGAIFSCRQEAVELGMFLMATQNTNTELRHRSRAWLTERAKDLRYLPNIPKSFIEHVSNPVFSKEQLEAYQQHLAGLNNRIAQDISTGATPGAVFVHPEFANTLIRNVEEHGVFRQDALVWPMGAETVHIPRRKSGVTIKWEGEAESTTSGEPDFELLGMTAKKMMMTNKYSSEVTEDAAISFADIFMFEYALAIALEEDRIGFNGDGSGGNSPGYAGFTGVLGAAANATEATAIADAVPHLVTGAAGANLVDEITLKKLREMLSRLHTWAEAGARWYANKSVFAILSGIETSAGWPVVDFRDPTSPTMMGYPIRKVDQMPAASTVAASTKCLALGDLRRGWVLGDRRRPEIMTSEHFAFDTDQITIRLTARHSFLQQQGNAMVVYQTGTG